MIDEMNIGKSKQMLQHFMEEKKGKLISVGTMTIYIRCADNPDFVRIFRNVIELDKDEDTIRVTMGRFDKTRPDKYGHPVETHLDKAWTTVKNVISLESN